MGGCKCVKEYCNEPFIRELEITMIEGEGSVVIEPTWEQVENALAGFETNKVGRITIRNPREVISMIIHGEAGVYHIGICEKETDFYYYWNGLETTDDTVDVAWNIFGANQICYDIITLQKIVHNFYKTGKRLEEAQWISEHL